MLFLFKWHLSKKRKNTIKLINSLFLFSTGNRYLFFNFKSNNLNNKRISWVGLIKRKILNLKILK